HIERVRDLRGRPTEDLGQEESGTLAGWKVLESGDECQANALAQSEALGGIDVAWNGALVRNRFEPMGSFEGVEGIIDVARRPVFDGACSSRALGERVDADVGGDAIEPRAN